MNTKTKPEQPVRGPLFAAALALALVFAPPIRADEARPAAAPGAGLAARIEAKLGTRLSEDQKGQIVQASREAAAKFRAAQASFVQAVAGAVQLPAAEIQAMMPKIGQPNPGFDKNIVPKLEAKLGRPLNEKESGALREADKAKKAVVIPVQAEFAATVAKIAGLPVETVQGLLPHIGL